MGIAPLKALRSPPQKPTILTRSKTSLSVGFGGSISRNSVLPGSTMYKAFIINLPQNLHVVFRPSFKPHLVLDRCDQLFDLGQQFGLVFEIENFHILLNMPKL